MLHGSFSEDASVNKGRVMTRFRGHILHNPGLGTRTSGRLVCYDARRQHGGGEGRMALSPERHPLFLSIIKEGFKLTSNVIDR